MTWNYIEAMCFYKIPTFLCEMYDAILFLSYSNRIQVIEVFKIKADLV